MRTLIRVLRTLIRGTEYPYKGYQSTLIRVPVPLYFGTLIRVPKYPYKGYRGTLIRVPRLTRARPARLSKGRAGFARLSGTPARLLAMCTPIVGVHMACSVLGMACSPCTPFQRGVQRLHAVFIRRADGRAHALRACRYQAPS
ncbi:hypothetical protein PCANC_24794 [Puccinia coronata f. sp. avenae]|uniref:Uncharacterized protein n=1 Tax=Puccinia coronata f. sp. avenae TaxID=200324 RepID=A0A2N5S2N7_9BASI|nr:hypothetical protein PCANC_24794 [Puccinia coronata f. sp. avenae]